MRNSKPLDKSIVENWYPTRDALDKIESQICDRLTYVLSTLFDTFGFELETWYFEGAEEGSVGEMHIRSDYIDGIIVESKHDRYGQVKINLIDKFGSDWDFSGDIPVRWLYDEFESEIIEGKAKYEAKELARQKADKLLSAKQKEKRDALLASAKSKLTKEELKALKGIL